MFGPDDRTLTPTLVIPSVMHRSFMREVGVFRLILHRLIGGLIGYRRRELVAGRLTFHVKHLASPQREGGPQRRA